MTPEVIQNRRELVKGWPDDYLIPGIEPYHVEEAGIIYNADCRDILPHLPKVDLCLTDPPYFLPAKTHCGTRAEGSYKRTLADTSVLTGYFKDVFNNINIGENGSYYIFCDAQSYPCFYQGLYPHTKYVRLLIWDKLISFNGYTWRHQHELIAWGEKDKSPRIATGDGDVIKCRAVLQKDREHPAQKPTDIFTKLIAKHNEANIILDPFLGSGTTAVAAKELGRKFIGIEISREYADIAVKRLKQCCVLPFSDEHNVKKGHGDTQNSMLNYRQQLFAW